MPYRRSFPLQRWSGERRAAINLLARAHRDIGEIGGPRRPPEIGRPLAHAYILRVVAEFQGFARDLHGLAAERLVAMSQVPTQHHAELVTGITHGRRLDSGNADLPTLREDLTRLGVTELGTKLSQHDQRYWTHDRAKLDSLLRLRNALAHGNQTQLDRIRGEGIRDTRSWARDCVPPLNRITSALDRVVGIISATSSARTRGDMAAQKLKAGAPVVVPWGLGEVHGEILEVWGNPPQHVRVRLHLGEPSEPDEFHGVDEADEDVVVVLSAELVEARPVV